MKKLAILAVILGVVAIAVAVSKEMAHVNVFDRNAADADEK
jgi:hypothetical protein